MRRSHHETSWLTASYHKEIEKYKDTRDEAVQTELEFKRSALVRKSLEILEIKDLENATDLDVTFEKNLDFIESEQEDYQTPSDFLEPLNEAVAEQIDQLIAKLDDRVPSSE